MAYFSKENKYSYLKLQAFHANTTKNAFTANSQSMHDTFKGQNRQIEGAFYSSRSK